jgi:hypothetical protein
LNVARSRGCGSRPGSRVAADRGPLPTRSRLQIERPELVDADDDLWLILARLRLASAIA